MEATENESDESFAKLGRTNKMKEKLYKRPLAIVAAAIGLAAGSFAATIDLSTVTSDLTLDNYDVITGTLGANVKISIADGALVHLRNVTIDRGHSSSCKWAGLTCLGDAQIRIDGENTVKGFDESYPGIYVPEGKTLTISQAVNISGYAALGGGMLTAGDSGMAAGIGGGHNLSCGNVVVNSGIITAYGHNSAGIGGGCNSFCGDITINGGVVRATGASKCAGIGGSQNMSCGAITIGDGVALVVAQAGSDCENPIGAGSGGTCGAVTVNLAEDATDTASMKSFIYHVRTIERPSIVQQYANGLAWDFRIANGEAEICDMYYTSDGEAHYRSAIDSTYAGTLVIPGTLGGCPVTRIGNYAFAFCKKITSVTIPASVTSIGEGAFQLCEELTDATLPAGVTSIGARAFESCSKLATAAIPPTVTSIGTMAFYGCDGLTSVTIPGGVKSIGHSAFEGCGGLTSVTIMDGVETIGESAFRDCDSLPGITIPTSVKTVEERAFWECTSLATVNCPEGTVIEDGAFYGCSALADANGFLIINGVLHQYMGGAADVAVPADVTRIGAMAFAAHTSNPKFGGYPPLVSVTIPDSVTSIGMMAFAYCTDLEHVTFPANMPSVEDSAFLLCVKLADADGFVIIGGALHLYIGTVSEVTIPDGVTSIGPQSFLTYKEVSPYYGPSPVTSLTIPSGVTNIYPQAFGYCPGLTTVSIPASVTSIGEGAFYEMLGSTVPLQTVHVDADDTERVKGLLLASGHPVDGITFVEDYLPSPPEPVDPAPVDPAPVDPAPVDPAPVDPAPVDPAPAPCYAVLGACDITAPYAAERAVTLRGAAYDGCDVVGIVNLKLGKVNAKKKTSKISGSVTTLDGKKHKITASNLTGIDGTAPKDVSLKVKGLGTMAITIGGKQFAGSMGKYHVQSATVGGNWNKSGTKVYVDTSNASLPGGTLEDLLPDGEPVVASGGKWKFAKAAVVKWAKVKKGVAQPEIFDGASGKGLVVNTSAGKTNVSGMKLTYTPKKGTFKGSFKVYALTGAGKAKKLKKYTVKVSGVVVGGVGYGTATCKKPAVNWAVTVK